MLCCMSVVCCVCKCMLCVMYVVSETCEGVEPSLMLMYDLYALSLGTFLHSPIFPFPCLLLHERKQVRVCRSYACRVFEGY